ncbi:MAG: hypothetical protein P8R54_02320 [Myxococcota bacterium]|nr:hypothetical protein [Myxococcota bacterium]
MGEMIRKPDTNPVIVAAANLILGALGYYLIGQEKKAMIAAIATIVLFPFTCGFLAIPAILIFSYDGYLLGQKLQSGQSISENENGLEFLNTIFKD